MMTPFVSLCTITRNRANLLPRLYECIQTQDFPVEHMEWIIHDDSDEPLTHEVISQFKQINLSYVYSNTTISIGSKRNKVNAMARGDIIVYLDDDDFYPQTRVSHAVHALESTDKLVAGCKWYPTLYLDTGETWIHGPFRDNNFSLANSLAFKRSYLATNQFNPESMFGEEKSFLNNYRTEVEGLDPFQTIVCISHSKNTANTIEVRKSKEAGRNNMTMKRFNPETDLQKQVLGDIANSYRLVMA